MKEYAEKQDFSVLVVDDEIDAAESVSTILERLGAKVKCVYDAYTAEKEIRENTYDAAIVDIVMPDKTGIELIDSVKEEIIKKDITIIILSAQPSYESAVQALRLRVVEDYIEKGANSYKLLKNIISNLMAEKKQKRTSQENEKRILELKIEELNKKILERENKIEELEGRIKENLEKFNTFYRNVAGILKELQTLKGKLNDRERELMNTLKDEIGHIKKTLKFEI